MRILSSDEVFYTSDTHFRHRKILEYQPNRGFNDIDEMDEAIISNWNAIVPPDATVIHHGDFAFSSKTRKREFKSRLNGNIILLLGNHDYHRECAEIFGEDNVKHCLYYRVDDQWIYSCHYPMASWTDAEDGSWMLHGHYHGHKVDDTLYKRKDVGIDTISEMRPYRHSEIKLFMNTRTLTPIRHPE